MTDSKPPRKRQKKESSVEKVTIRDHDWAYANLQLLYDPPHTFRSPVWPPDILTWRTTLTSALTQFLGITGSALQIDILHLEGDEAWVRFPRTEMNRFGAAVSGYVGFSGQTVMGRAGERRQQTMGFRIVAMGEFLMGVVSKKAEAAIWSD